MQVNKRRHRLCEKNAIAAMIITVPVGLLVQFGYLAPENFGDLVVILLSMLLLFLFGKWFSPEFEGVFRAHIPLKETIILTSPMIIVTIGAVIINVLNYGFIFRPSFSSLCIALVAGVYEETNFRAMMIPIGMRYLKESNRPQKTVIISSIIFGVFHLSNILSGGDIITTIIQVVMATCAGTVLAAVYLRSGSIIPAMTIHAIYDLVNFVTDPTINESGLTTSEIANNSAEIIVPTLFLSIFLAAAGAYLIRKSKAGVIEKIWQEKWSKFERKIYQEGEEELK